MLKAEYRTRGPVPHDTIEAVDMTLPDPAAKAIPRPSCR